MSTVTEYVEQLKTDINWKYVVKAARENVQIAADRQRLGYHLLGSVFSLTPSGKYYMPWCSNFTEEEAEEDERWYEALDRVALEMGGWIEHGEGDPLDLFFVTDLELEV
ncbi:MAG: hypothetical protein M0R06_04510 [Sphaerochaeta sp.]|jgi:hypothetical protein|nr:hypothetical protein [Sphaerochaeta sp.]